MNLLDKLALKYGTDKSSVKHNYTQVYDLLFKDRREEITSVLELGVYNGASLKMWADYFPNADVWGVDIRKQSYKTDNARIHHIQADATYPMVINKIMSNTLPQLVIDDASHDMLDQQLSFEHIFPSLKSGAIYVIEDLHTSYMPEHGGGENRDHLPNKSPKAGIYGRTVDWLSELTYAVNCPMSLRKHLFLGRYYGYSEHIKSMLFFKNIVFIEKR